MGESLFWILSKVLLLGWCDNLSFDRDYQLVEVFSGEGNLSRAWYLVKTLYISIS